MKNLLKSNVDRFKRLIDENSAQDTVSGEALDYLYIKYNIPEGGRKTTTNLKQLFFEKIAELLLVSDSDTITPFYFFKIGSSLALQHYYGNQSLHLHLIIYEIIRDATRKLHSYPALDQYDRWKKVISIIQDYRLLNETRYENYNVLFLREKNVAEAYKRLAGRGYQIQMENGLGIEESERLRISRTIENMIEKIGGGYIVSEIIKTLGEKAYDIQMERYNFGHVFSPDGLCYDPAIPFGYFLNLCIKDFRHFRSRGSVGVSWEQLINLLKDIAAVYNVQIYNKYNVYSINAETIMEFLQDNIVYDTLFSIGQLRPRDSILILKGTLKWIDNRMIEQHFGWKLEDAIDLADNILLMAKKKGVHNPLYFRAEDSEIQGKNKLNPTILKKILEIYSHHQKPNDNFYLPNQAYEINYHFKPLLKTTSGEYVLVNSSWSAPAFYEALATTFRPLFQNEKFDKRVGDELEQFIKKILSDHGIQSYSGQFKVNQSSGDSDVFVETPEAIIFIEVKKKVLTRKARAGSEIDILIDVSDSLLRAQEQLGRQELLIQKNGFIEIVEKSSGDQYKLELQNRRIERVVITLHDYGCLQNRDMVKTLLNNFQLLKFNCSDEKYNGKLQELSKRCKTLFDQNLELMKKNQNGIPPFNNCWFFSVSQLMILLDDVSSPSEFFSKLNRYRSITCGTLDFYTEKRAIDKLFLK